jgi:FMN reductase
LISTAGGVQGLQAINTMEYVVRALRGFTLPMVIPVSRAWQVFDKETGIKDSAIEKHLLTLGKELYLAARATFKANGG